MPLLRAQSRQVWGVKKGIDGADMAVIKLAADVNVHEWDHGGPIETVTGV
jgi:hypothetical protein